jgi:hypothetical protein
MSGKTPMAEIEADAKTLAILLKDNIRATPDRTTIYQHNFNPVALIAEMIRIHMEDAYIAGFVAAACHPIRKGHQGNSTFNHWWKTIREEEEKS